MTHLFLLYFIYIFFFFFFYLKRNRKKGYNFILLGSSVRFETHYSRHHRPTFFFFLFFFIFSCLFDLLMFSRLFSLALSSYSALRVNSHDTHTHTHQKDDHVIDSPDTVRMYTRNKEKKNNILSIQMGLDFFLLFVPSQGQLFSFRKMFKIGFKQGDIYFFFPPLFSCFFLFEISMT